MHTLAFQVVVGLEEEVDITVMSHEVVASIPDPAEALLLIASQLVQDLLVKCEAEHLAILIMSPLFRQIVSRCMWIRFDVIDKLLAHTCIRRGKG